MDWLGELREHMVTYKGPGGECGRPEKWSRRHPSAFSKSDQEALGQQRYGTGGGANLTSQRCSGGRLRKRAQRQAPNTSWRRWRSGQV
jgi:hypothetical protein